MRVRSDRGRISVEMLSPHASAAQSGEATMCLLDRAVEGG